MALHGRPPTMERTAAERKGVTVELGRTPAAARAGNAGAPTTWSACRSSRRAGGRAGGPYGRLSEHIVPHPLHHESDEVVLEAEAAVVALACACRSVSAGRRAPRCECTSRTAGSLAHRRVRLWFGAAMSGNCTLARVKWDRVAGGVARACMSRGARRRRALPRKKTFSSGVPIHWLT
jgi:hypothetical protein